MSEMTKNEAHRLEFRTMKESFKESIKYLYPAGCEDRLQVRDMARIYSMGWVDQLVVQADPEKVKKWVEEYSYMTAYTWMPDDSWNWW